MTVVAGFVPIVAGKLLTTLIFEVEGMFIVLLTRPFKEERVNYSDIFWRFINTIIFSLGLTITITATSLDANSVLILEVILWSLTGIIVLHFIRELNIPNLITEYKEWKIIKKISGLKEFDFSKSLLKVPYSFTSAQLDMGLNNVWSKAQKYWFLINYDPSQELTLGMMNMTELDLNQCDTVITLPSVLARLPNLKILNVNYCKQLSNINILDKLLVIEEVWMNGCVKVRGKNHLKLFLLLLFNHLKLLSFNHLQLLLISLIN